jgi:hypothetical protein
MKSAAPSRALIGSDRVEGTAVYDRAGSHTGTIKRLMIDKPTGQVAYVVVTFAFLGLADDTYTIPWRKLSYDTTLGGYLTDITEDELHGAPRFTARDEDDQPGHDQEEELHAYFRIPPYWRAM